MPCVFRMASEFKALEETMSRGARVVPLNEAELNNLRKGADLQKEAARVRIETLEELLYFGAPPNDIPSRAGWAHRGSMRKALARADRKDLWERYLKTC